MLHANIFGQNMPARNRTGKIILNFTIAHELYIIQKHDMLS